MPLKTRLAIAAIDDMLGMARSGAPFAAGVLLSWSRGDGRCAVVGLLDDAGGEIPVDAEILGRLTAVMAVPVTPEAVRMIQPEARVDGSLLLTLSTDTPVWSMVAENVFEQVQVGLGVSEDDLRDALWVLLEIAGMPNKAVYVERVVIVPEFPEDAVFAPVQLCDKADCSGRSVPWVTALDEYSDPRWGQIVASLSSELAERREQLNQRRGARGSVLTEAVIPL